VACRREKEKREAACGELESEKGSLLCEAFLRGRKRERS